MMSTVLTEEEEDSLAEKSSVTVTINDNGEINVDQEVLKSILDSNQQSATVTFVRVGEEEEEGGGDIILDTEEMHRLEKVLRSDEAKDFLNTVLGEGLPPPPPSSEATHLDHTYTESPPIDPPDTKKDEDEEDKSAKTVNAKKKPESGRMTRRSQRQIDKEMKEEAERIRLENQALMRKEMEAVKFKEEEEPAYAPALSPSPTGRPKRERKVPAHLMTGDYESSLIPATSKTTTTEITVKRRVSAGKVGPPVDEEDDDDDSGGDWNSEDDPERLWCICNQPHNNRFMICCDGCLDWFHGKCVGITKKMGKDMEESSHQWKCPKCIEPEALVIEKPVTPRKPIPSAATTSSAKKTPVKVKKDEGKKKIPIAPVEPEKPKKERTCFVCEKTPRVNSIFCSDECISKHANKAKALLQKNRLKTVDSKAKSFGDAINSDKTQVLVMEPKTNIMLNGPNAPTEGTLEIWLKSHPTFHVVMPTSHPTTKFYGQSSGKRATPKIVSPHHYRNKNVSIKLDSSKTFVAQKMTPPQANLSAEELREIEIKKVQKSLQQHHQKESSLKRNHSSKSVHPTKIRKESSHRPRSPPRKTAPSPPPPPQVVDPKPIRSNAVKGLYDALKGRMESAKDVEVSIEVLKTLVEEIEESLFRYYNKDVTSKYKAKYRSLVFNIKDEKNSGLFRKILSRKIDSNELVALTHEEMANKELQRWREKELKNDIEKIKSHELDMMKLGSKFVMKSHKGEIAIENDDSTIALSSAVSTTNPAPKLPDEINEIDPLPMSRRKDVIEGTKTWDHGTHEFEPTCDVCNGKKTLDEFLTIKIAKEKKEAKGSSRSSSSSRSHHKSDRKDKTSRHSKSSSSHRSRSKDRHKSSSSRDKSRKDSSTKDKGSDRQTSKDRDSRSSKDFSKQSSSSRHRHSSKESHHRSSSSDLKKTSSSKDNHENSSSKSQKSSSTKSHRSSSSKSLNNTSLKPHREKSSSNKESDSKNSTSIDPNLSSGTLKNSSPSSHSNVGDSSESKDGTKSLQEIWSSQKEESQNETSISSQVPPDSSGTQKKIEEAKKTIADVINSSSFTEHDEKNEAKERKEEGNNNAEVSSTVTIKTPDSETVETSPIVWKGELNMPDVAKFSVTAHQVSGTTDYLTVDLKPLLKIVGRIDPRTVWEYIAKIRENPNKEVLLIHLQPTSEDEKEPYVSFYKYLQTRNRFGVVGDSTGKMVKDCYVLPLSSSTTIHDCMFPFEGPGIDLSTSDTLLALIVRTRRKRSGEYENSKHHNLNHQKVKVLIVEGHSKLSSSSSSKNHKKENVLSGSKSRKRDSEEAYDPSSPVSELHTSTKELYDPDSAFPDEPSPTKKKKSLKTNPKFSDDEDDVQTDGSITHYPITSNSGGFTEKLAQLTAEIELQKKEINSIETNLIRPSTEGSRDPRQQRIAPTPSRLSNMTDEDLMAKAKEMLEQESFASPQPPTPTISLSTQPCNNLVQNSQPAGPWNNGTWINPLPGVWNVPESPAIQQQAPIPGVWNFDDRPFKNQFSKSNRHWYESDRSRDWHSSNRKGRRYEGNNKRRRRSRSPSPPGTSKQDFDEFDRRV